MLSSSKAEHNGLLHPGRGRALVTAEWALWPPGRALVPPSSQSGPAQSPQEIPRSQVGEAGAREAGEECLVHLAGWWVMAVCREKGYRGELILVISEVSLGALGSG